MVHLGDTARHVREILGLTQRDAASQLGISPVHLCNIENGKSLPSPELLSRFHDLWEVDLYVFAWCQHGNVDKLPSGIRNSARALAQSWKKQLDNLVQKKKRSSSSCSTSGK